MRTGLPTPVRKPNESVGQRISAKLLRMFQITIHDPLATRLAGGALVHSCGLIDFTGGVGQVVEDWEAFFHTLSDAKLEPIALNIPEQVIEAFERHELCDQMVVGYRWKKLANKRTARVIVEAASTHDMIILRAGDARRICMLQKFAEQVLTREQGANADHLLLSMNDVGIGYAKTALVDRVGMLKALEQAVTEGVPRVFLMGQTALELGLRDLVEPKQSIVSGQAMQIHIRKSISSWLATASKDANQVVDLAQYLLDRFVDPAAVTVEDLDNGLQHSAVNEQQQTGATWHEIVAASKRARETVSLSGQLDNLSTPHHHSDQVYEPPQTWRHDIRDIYVPFIRAVHRCKVKPDILAHAQQRILRHHLAGLPVSPVDIPLLTMVLGQQGGLPVTEFRTQPDRAASTAQVSHMMGHALVHDHDVVTTPDKAFLLAVRPNLYYRERALLVRRRPIWLCIATVSLGVVVIVFITIQARQDRRPANEIIQTTADLLTVYIATIIPIFMSFFYNGESVRDLLRGRWAVDSEEEVAWFTERARWSLVLAAFRLGTPFLINKRNACIEHASDDGIIRQPGIISVNSIHLFGLEYVTDVHGDEWVWDKAAAKLGKVRTPDTRLRERCVICVTEWKSYEPLVVAGKPNSVDFRGIKASRI